MIVGSTIVVEFGQGADSSAFVAVEPDETLNLDEAGAEKSQFAPGDEVWFWVQHDASLVIDRIEATSGMVVDCGTAKRERSQELTWTGADAVELSHIPSANPAYVWFGTIGDGLTRDGRLVSVGLESTPCTCDAVIPIDVRLFRFVPPVLELGPEESFRVVIVVYMEAAA